MNRVHIVRRFLARRRQRVMAQPCIRCGHDRGTHTHYRHGSDCGLCGPRLCPEFKR